MCVLEFGLLFWRARRGGWWVGGWGWYVWYVRRGFVCGGEEGRFGFWGLGRFDASLARRDEGQALRVWWCLRMSRVRYMTSVRKAVCVIKGVTVTVWSVRGWDG